MVARYFYKTTKNNPLYTTLLITYIIYYNSAHYQFLELLKSC